MKPSPTPNSAGAFTLPELLVVVAVTALLAGLATASLRTARGKAQRIQCMNNLKNIGLAFRTDAATAGPLGTLLGQWRETFETTAAAAAPAETNRPVDLGPALSAGGARREPNSVSLTPQAWQLASTLSHELGKPELWICPGDTRTPAKNWASLRNSNLSYFMGLDATELNPASWLAGDRSLATNGVPLPSGLVEVHPGSRPAFTDNLHRGGGNLAMGDGSVQGLAGVLPGGFGAAGGQRLVIP